MHPSCVVRRRRVPLRVSAMRSFREQGGRARFHAVPFHPISVRPSTRAVVSRHRSPAFVKTKYFFSFHRVVVVVVVVPSEDACRRRRARTLTPHRGCTIVDIGDLRECLFSDYVSQCVVRDGSSVEGWSGSGSESGSSLDRSIRPPIHWWVNRLVDC